MGNRYKIMCLGCHEYFDLDSENTWWQNKELMYCLKDFLLSHPDHELKIGGDEWNRAFDYNNDSDGEELPLADYKEYDSRYSKEDFKGENK